MADYPSSPDYDPNTVKSLFEDAAWGKSFASEPNGGNCVEVNLGREGLVGVRDTKLAGRVIPAGSMLIFSPYVLHRRADQFPAPGRFDPDRWLTPDQDRSAPHRTSFLPFGTGAARCIGEDFGLAEATLILSSVCARWKQQHTEAKGAQDLHRRVDATPVVFEERPH